MLLDSRSIAARANILRNDLPPPGQDEGPLWLDRLRNLVHGRFNTQQLPLYEDIGVANGADYPEVARRWMASRNPSCGPMRAARR